MPDSTIGNLPSTATTFTDADLTVIEQGGTTKKIAGANYAAGAAFDRYRLFANVKDPAYGALGDGVTNDLAAFVAAVAACSAAGGGTVFVPRGTYVLGTAAFSAGLLSIPSNVELVGEGRKASILKPAFTANGSICVIFSSVDHAAIRHIGIQHTASTTSSVAINLDSSTNCVVEDCWVSAAFGWSVFMGGSTNCGAVRVVSDGTTNAHGIEFNGSSYCWAEGCYIFNSGQTLGTNGIELYDASANRCEGNRIVNNWIDAPDGSGILCVGVFDTVIEGNVILNPGTMGIGLTVSAYDATRFSRAVTITGNTILGAGRLGTTSGAIALSDCTACTVTANGVRGSGGSTPGIFVSDIHNTVSGNTCTLNGGYGIFVATTAARTSVIGNICTDNSVTGVGSRDGIIIQGDSCTVIGNICSDTRGGSARQQIGLNIASGTGNVVVGNRGTGNLGAAVADSGTSTIKLGNEGLAEPAGAITDERVYIDATGDRVIIAGTPASVDFNGGVGNALAFDGTADEQVGYKWGVPNHWASMAIDIVWSKISASAGDVLWEITGDPVADGEVWGSVNTFTGTPAAIAAPTATQAKTSAIVTSFALTAKLGYLWLKRNADGATDTLNGIDAHVQFIVLRRTA